MIHLFDSVLCGATFLLAFIIWVNNNKFNTKANHWFSAFVFCIFLLVLENILLYTKIIPENVLISEMISLVSLIIAPVFFLSICYYVYPVRKWKKTDFLHFAFATLIFVLILLSHLIPVESPPKKVSEEAINTASLILNTLFGLQVISYCILAFLKIGRHQKNIQLINSTVEHINLEWVKNITICIFIIALFWVSDIIFNLSDSSERFDIISSLVYIIGILYTTYYWQRQKEIFPYDVKAKEEINVIINETAIPLDSRKKLLSDERLEQLKDALLELMNTEKPFLDADLSLVKLASALNISSHLLSYVINKGFNENFYQFINRYRVEEAKKRILDPEMGHLSILGIGFEVGFNSKTAFNTTFKKVTGKSPTAFKNSIQ